mmetsp:Transcript_10747/g.21583  ORF Transcript_10747/g.21583 Transcript_10747/m.21583 type:complete len:82 (+) Transcript_10747:643-888(+)|eukprot:CAMPEP_0184684090 /NCGR_PEP_ID=MMETSP0312-20130426/13766_1 /TAXON_ID=31354 /ORGANISM="Compsopogon coeruleus, Strain SAG 36.94" /LENGTH=81 /DNA_ID=CAMNT_0027136931 /DNA_START=577 /DNA_END=822 /DNA_ORIENTATION=-
MPVEQRELVGLGLGPLAGAGVGDPEPATEPAKVDEGAVEDDAEPLNGCDGVATVIQPRTSADLQAYTFLRLQISVPIKSQT